MSWIPRRLRARKRRGKFRERRSVGVARVGERNEDDRSNFLLVFGLDLPWFLAVRHVMSDLLRV